MNKLSNSLGKKIDPNEIRKQAEQITDKNKLETRNEKTIRLSISVFESVHKKLKIAAIEKNSNIQEIVSNLIDEFLNNEITI